MEQTVLVALIAIGMAAGLVGIVIPFMPGLILVWGSALAYGLFADFGEVGVIAFAVITVLFIVGEAMGYILPGRAAGQAGASTSSIVIGAVCAIAGFFVIPIFGLPIGGVLGIYVAELIRTNNGEDAWRATWATLVGFGVGVLVQLGAGFAMVIAWLIWVIAG